jgi:transposase
LRTRRYLSGEDKMKLLRRHLIEKLPVSKICEEADINPNLFYRWQEQLFTNGSLAFEGKQRSDRSEEQARIEKLENKIRQKDEVLAELMAEHVALKKEFGEL